MEVQGLVLRWRGGDSTCSEEEGCSNLELKWEADNLQGSSLSSHSTLLSVSKTETPKLV